MKYKECFISWCWSHITLSIILGGFRALKLQVYYVRNPKLAHILVSL